MKKPEKKQEPKKAELTQTGWKCPACGAGNAPWKGTCDCKKTTIPGIWPDIPRVWGIVHRRAAMGRHECGIPGDGNYTHFHFFDGIGPPVGNEHTGAGIIQLQHNWNICRIVCNMADQPDRSGIDRQPADVEHQNI